MNAENREPEHNNRKMCTRDTVKHGSRVANELNCHDVNKFTSVTHAVTMVISIRENWLFCSPTYSYIFLGCGPGYVENLLKMTLFSLEALSSYTRQHSIS